jgi:hypothetical protein
VRLAYTKQKVEVSLDLFVNRVAQEPAVDPAALPQPQLVSQEPAVASEDGMKLFKEFSKLVDLEQDWVLPAPFLSTSTVLGDINDHLSLSSSDTLPGNAAENDLRVLCEMGFVDNKKNLSLLLYYKGDVDAVVDALIAESLR